MLLLYKFKIITLYFKIFPGNEKVDYVKNGGNYKHLQLVVYNHR